jgi:hypothetical protein
MSKDTALPPVSETGARVDAVAEWRSQLAAVTGAYLLFETLTGLAIWLLPFSGFNQVGVLLHSVAGVAVLPWIIWYQVRHWLVRRGGNLSHHQLLGYAALTVLTVCVVSGFVLTWQGFFGPRMSTTWDIVHLVSGIGVPLFTVVHLATLIVRAVHSPEALLRLRTARAVFYRRSAIGAVVMMALTGAISMQYDSDRVGQPFPEDYNWTFGEDRPFAPSLARVERIGWDEQVRGGAIAAMAPDLRGAFSTALDEKRDASIGLFDHVRAAVEAVDGSDTDRSAIEGVLASAATEVRERGATAASVLSGSARCGTSGCHQEIYEEWLPSAHRYSSLDDMFQKVQEIMAVETSPETTRYCAGCHDPISLFSGAKNQGNITLSAEGADEGASCLVCHSIVQTDVQGNGDYTMRQPERYVLEQADGEFARLVSDFLIRTYPQQHIESYSRSLYKTPEFCAACHKQYVDMEVNTDIGKVQGQNQYDSWKNSRWHHADDPRRDLSCRECHMPLVDSIDPARGDMTDINRSPDDGKHRSHGMPASNQYIPLRHNLKNAEKHVALIEQWLKGEFEIPEIADKWTSGPVVRLDVIAPSQVSPGDQVPLKVLMTNNKTGHDFPTGPLDMIESWVEISVTSSDGREVFRAGGLDAEDEVTGSPILMKADGFDREGAPIDRHNLWDLVGSSYKRAMYPGVTDAVDLEFQCPSMARGRLSRDDEKLPPGQRAEEFGFVADADTPADELTVTASLWYRKANPEFLETVYGAGTNVRSPITLMTRTQARIAITPRE